MKNINKFAFAALMLISFNGLGSIVNVNTQPVFKGTIKLIGNLKSGNDTLSIVYRKPYQPFGTRETEFKVISDINGHFEFKLPRFEDPLEMRIYLRYRGTDSRSGIIGTRFIVEPNDSINVSIIKTGRHKSDSVVFSGKGNEKYNIAVNLEKLCSYNRGYGEFREGLKKIFYNNGDLDTSNFQNKIIAYCEFTKKKMMKKMI